MEDHDNSDLKPIGEKKIIDHKFVSFDPWMSIDYDCYLRSFYGSNHDSTLSHGSN